MSSNIAHQAEVAINNNGTNLNNTQYGGLLSPDTNLQSSSDSSTLQQRATSRYGDYGGNPCKELWGSFPFSYSGVSGTFQMHRESSNILNTLSTRNVPIEQLLTSKSCSGTRQYYPECSTASLRRLFAARSLPPSTSQHREPRTTGVGWLCTYHLRSFPAKFPHKRRLCA